MHVRVLFLPIRETISGLNTNLVGTGDPNGDKRPVLMQLNVISDILVAVGAMVSIGRLRLGLGRNLQRLQVRVYTTNGSQCTVLTQPI